MRVGKSGIIQCDYCEEVVSGTPDSLTHQGKTFHFCPGSCLNDHLLEDQFHDIIEEKVEIRVQQELRLLHKNVCPACKWRIARKYDLMEQPPCPSCGYSESEPE